MEYSLAEYKNKPVTIYFSADVMRTGKGKGMSWTVNNDPEYPSVTAVKDNIPGVWYNMSGNMTVIPSNNTPFLHLNKWEERSPNAFFYVDNIKIRIETWDYAPASIIATIDRRAVTARKIFMSARVKGKTAGTVRKTARLRKLPMPRIMRNPAIPYWSIREHIAKDLFCRRERRENL